MDGTAFPASAGYVLQVVGFLIWAGLLLWRWLRNLSRAGKGALTGWRLVWAVGEIGILGFVGGLLFWVRLPVTSGERVPFMVDGKVDSGFLGIVAGLSGCFAAFGIGGFLSTVIQARIVWRAKSKSRAGHGAEET